MGVELSIRANQESGFLPANEKKLSTFNYVIKYSFSIPH